jgi:aspartate-semialdehyde dehydrogenase
MNEFTAGRGNMKIPVGVLGVIGMVEQNYISLLNEHPWFEERFVALPPLSAGKKYKEAVAGRWQLAETYTDAADVPVVSNASARRFTTDVPMLIMEVNPHHTDVIPLQQKNHGFEMKRTIVTTMQAVSGAGYPGIANLDIIDNVVPFIRGEEEEKSELEPLEILGTVENGVIKPKEEDNRPQPRKDRDADKSMAVTVGCIRPCPVFDVYFAGLSYNTARPSAIFSTRNYSRLKSLWTRRRQ